MKRSVSEGSASPSHIDTVKIRELNILTYWTTELDVNSVLDSSLIRRLKMRTLA
jgi:hypothetical protein